MQANSKIVETSVGSPGWPALRPDNVGNWGELLRWRSAQQPLRVGYTFLADGPLEEQTFTYRELDQRARAIGAWLQSQSSRGERALLLYPPGLEYIGAPFGCFYAGVVAVPAYPPRQNKSVDRLETLVHDSGATIARTTAN